MTPLDRWNCSIGSVLEIIVGSVILMRDEVTFLSGIRFNFRGVANLVFDAEYPILVPPLGGLQVPPRDHLVEVMA